MPKTEKKIIVIIQDKEYFRIKMRESRIRNKEVYYIVIEGKAYVFKKEQITKIKPKFIDNLVHPTLLY